MNPVHEPMDERCHDHGSHPDKRQPGKQRIKGGKDFGGIGGERIDRPHPTGNHRRIQQGIHPAQSANPMVAKDSDPQSQGHDDQGGD